MLGCSETDSSTLRVKSIVGMMGEPNKTFCCGKLGTGLAAKISNNYLSGVFNCAVAESMAIGIRSGVDPKMLYEIIKNSSGMSWMGTNKQPAPDIVPEAPSSNGYRPGFRVELMIKDLTLGADAGDVTGIKPTMARTALETYHKANQDERCKVSGILGLLHQRNIKTHSWQGRDVTSLYLYITDA